MSCDILTIPEGVVKWEDHSERCDTWLTSDTCGIMEASFQLKRERENYNNPL
jgi:hypothetical protein